MSEHRKQRGSESKQLGSTPVTAMEKSTDIIIIFNDGLPLNGVWLYLFHCSFFHTKLALGRIRLLRAVKLVTLGDIWEVICYNESSQFICKIRITNGNLYSLNLWKTHVKNKLFTKVIWPWHHDAWFQSFFRWSILNLNA